MDTCPRQQSHTFTSEHAVARWFPQVENLPDSWPMARMFIPIDGLIFQAERIAISASMEIIAKC